MSRATMMAALLGTVLARPSSAAAFAETDTSAMTAPQQPAGSVPEASAGVPGEPQEVMGAPFTVEGIDRVNRSLMLRTPEGSRTTITVAATAEGFDSLEKGDQIALDYYAASLLSLGPKAASTVAAAASEAPTRANAPVLGAAGGRQITTVARVTGVDDEDGTLQMRTPDGRPHALVVRDPGARLRLQSLHSGDRVTVTYTEAVAVAVHAGAAGAE